MENKPRVWSNVEEDANIKIYRSIRESGKAIFERLNDEKSSLKSPHMNRDTKSRIKKIKQLFKATQRNENRKLKLLIM